MAELLSLDGLQLNSVFTGGPYTLSRFVNNPPKKRPEWQERTDGDGAALLRDPLVENRQPEGTIEVMTTSRDAAQAAVGQIIDKLEKADRTPGGIPLVWRPDGSTRALTYFVLTGEVTGPEITVEKGYFGDDPNLILEFALTCRPYGYEPKVTGPSVIQGAPLVTLTIPNVGGDVPAEAELLVTDQTGQQHDFVAWGLEQRYQTGADLTLTVAELSTASTSGALASRGGAYSGQVIRSLLGPSPFAVAATGNQSQVGTFRVYLRSWWSTLTQTKALGAVRLAHRSGDGPLEHGPWVTPPKANVFCELDLGTITVEATNTGAQRWQGFIEAYSTNPAGGDAFETDYLDLVPTLEGFGRARRTIPFSSLGATIAWDGFLQTSGGLSGKTMQVGGAWGNATGDADDWQVDPATGVAFRNTAADSAVFGRGILAGTSTPGEAIHQVDFRPMDLDPGNGSPMVAMVARWVDWNNFLMLQWFPTSGVVSLLRVTAWNGGGSASATPLGEGAVSAATPEAFYSLRVQPSADGRVAVWLWPREGGSPQLILVGYHADLKTGGPLASGRHGLIDRTGSLSFIRREYDNYLVAQVGDLPDAVLFPNRQIRFGFDETTRQDATGIYTGEPQEYRGSPFMLPPAGDNNLSSRVAVMVRRNDIHELDSSFPTDATTVQANWWPRWYSVPG